MLSPPSLTELPRDGPPRRLSPAQTAFHGVLLLVLVGVLALTTGVLFLVPGISFVVLAPELDYVSNTAAMVIAGAIGVLAWIRSRETNEPDAIYQASAFFVLFLGGAIAILLLVSDRAVDAGFDRTAPGQAPLYLWTAQRLFAAVLLLAGAGAALRRTRPPAPAHAAGIVIVPGIALLALSAVVLVGRHGLPVLVPPDDLVKMTNAIDHLDSWILSAPLTVVQLTLAALFSAAAASYFRVYRREGGSRTYLAYLSAALVIAAFSQVHFAVVPGAYSDLLTSGDVLRVAFYVLLGLGLVAGWRRDLHELRAANDTLVRLGALDAERVALEERARMARDIHDGLVQEIWLARLTHGQLIGALEGIGNLPTTVRDAARRVDGILDEALAEARQAVVTLQPQENDGFGGMLSRSVEDYADRFGLDVECTVPAGTITLSTQEQGEIIRICREALNNARKHANASLVRVDLESRPDGLRLMVADDGSGFDPAGARIGFGLRSMRDRAQGLGGSLQVDAAPQAGTRITLDLPRRQQ